MKQLYKYFVFSDVHGEYDDLVKALQDAGYEESNPTHKLISVGDAFDRGPKSKKIYDLLKRNKAICVKGNHDLFFEEYLEKGMDGEFVLFNILHNGLGATIASFGNLDKLEVFKIKELEDIRRYILNNNHTLKDWLKNMPLYYETEHFIFCHAGINPHLSNWKDTDEHYMTWDIEDSHLPCPQVNKFVVIGHHHAFRVRANAVANGFMENKTLPKYQIKDNEGRNIMKYVKGFGNTDENAIYSCENKIALDGCVNLTHKVNVMVIEDYEKESGLEEIKVTSEQNVNTGIWSNLDYSTQFATENITTATYTINTDGGFRF